MKCDPAAPAAIENIPPFKTMDAVTPLKHAVVLSGRIVLPALETLPISGTITIRFTPIFKTIEVLSFKDYLLAFGQTRPCFETVLNKVFQDCKDQLALQHVVVEGSFDLGDGHTLTLTRNA